MRCWIIEKDPDPVETQNIVHAMPDPLKSRAQTFNFGDVFAELYNFFQHSPATQVTFFCQALRGNILHGSDDADEAVPLSVPDWMSIYPHPLYFFLLCIGAQVMYNLLIES